MRAVAIGCLEEQAQPFLRAGRTAALGQFHEPAQVETHRGGEDGIPVLTANPQLHRLTQKTCDVDIIPTFLRIAPRREVIDLDEVIRFVAEHRAQEFGLVPDLLPALDRVAHDFAVVVAK